MQDQSPPPSFSQEERQYLIHCVSDYRIWAQDKLEAPLRRSLRVLLPAAITDHLQRLHHTERMIGGDFNVPFDCTEDDLRVIRRALLHRRKAYAEEHEGAAAQDVTWGNPR